MKIRNVRHRGVRHLFLEDRTDGVPSDCVHKLRLMLAFLQDMQSEEELRELPRWRAHPLSGARIGTWSLAVTRNWRLTFRIDQGGPAVCDLDFEDYH